MRLAVFMALAMMILVAVPLIIANVVQRGETRYEKVAREFKQSCSDVRGQTVWNGRHWECLK